MNTGSAKTQFLEYLEIEKGLSLKTVENYDRYLTRFFEFANIKDVGKITEDKLREFRIHLNRQLGVKVKANLKQISKKILKTITSSPFELF